MYALLHDRVEYSMCKLFCGQVVQVFFLSVSASVSARYSLQPVLHLKLNEGRLGYRAYRKPPLFQF